MSEQWTPFWWESNACWGTIESPADWLAMVDRYAQHHGMGRAEAVATMLDRGAVCAVSGRYEGPISIGTRREHIGGQTLRAWAAELGMNLEVRDE